MSREPSVSWRCGEALLEFARLAKMDTRQLVVGLPFDERTVRSAGWIAWDSYCTVVERLEAALGSPEAVQRFALDHLAFKEVHAIAGAFVEARLLYRFIFRVVDPMMFPPMAFRYEELPDGRILVEARIRPEARPCPALARISVGGIRALPRYLGLPAATIEWSAPDDRTAIYFVTLPESQTLAARLKRRARKNVDSMVDLLQVFVDEVGSAAWPKEPTRGEAELRERLMRFAVRHGLTERQREVLEGIVAGLTNKEIAAQHRCAENTVELHVSNLFRRLQVQSRTQLVSRFWRG